MALRNVLLLVATLAVFSAVKGSTCPAADEIAPCSCDDEGISCYTITAIEQFERVFRANCSKKAAKAVWLIGTPLTKMAANTFNGYLFETISIDKNEIEFVESGTFEGTERGLKSLSLYGNKLTSFPFQDLIKFSRLTSLSLAANKIRTIPSGSLVNIPSLIQLILKDNEITTLGKQSFANCPNLKGVDLSGNKITSLGSSTFGRMRTAINLQGNGIDFIHPEAFDDTELGALDLTDNKLETLDPRLFLRLLKNVVLVGGNPFTCFGCAEWHWVVDNKDKFNQMFHETFRCADGTTLEDLTLESIGCSSD
ncbi:Oplophorus-luciferin 2-monooxygenase non-catalytic subunit [Halotydeus destructor]|nr:Oplophorus-luciferin 2-monooxygenase non-catalytic subunit [Halotydeus destructor]